MGYVQALGVLRGYTTGGYNGATGVKGQWWSQEDRRGGGP